MNDEYGRSSAKREEFLFFGNDAMRGLSRRDFLKIAGVGTVAAISTSALVACEKEEPDTMPDDASAPNPDAGPSKPSYVTQPGEAMTAEEVDWYMWQYTHNVTEERSGVKQDPVKVARIRRFLEEDDGQPFWMINLIREQDSPKYPDWWTGERGATVTECKKLYSKACYPIMAKGGTQSCFGVALCSDFVLTDDEGIAPWDQFYLVGYPCRKAFMMLLSSEEYASAVVHKYAGDKDTQLIPVTGSDVNVLKVYDDHTPLTQDEVDSYMAAYTTNLTEERTGRKLDTETVNRIRKFLEGDDGKPFYMINLVREWDSPRYPDWWSGERGTTVTECKQFYSKACYPIMAQSGSFSFMGVCRTYPAVITDDEKMEDWDQFYLISYPSRGAFMNLLVSDDYADAIVHKYAGDKDTQLIPVTSNSITSPKIKTDIRYE